MNCKHVQELLPLYVSRDLEEKVTRLVMAHLQSCAECSGLAGEYDETRRLLENFTPPFFSEAVYAGVRRRVWAEIEAETPERIAPSLSQLVASLFRPRLTWAVVTALLLAVSLFAFFLIPNRGNNRRQVADVQPPQRPGPTASSSPAVPAPRENNGPQFKNKGTDMAIVGTGGHTPPTQRRKILRVAAVQTAVPANKLSERSITAEASRERNNLAESGAVPVRQPLAGEKTLRLEMQTKDPNIRIIWFSHQRTNTELPN
jgi:putative zinc finger protein